MNLRIMHVWDALRGSLWFVPGVMMIGSILLAGVMISIDEKHPGAPGSRGLLHAGSVEGAREVLGVIAASMVSVAALTFSITTVTLTVAGQKYGSRLLRNFMRDTATQVVLGTFTGTFTYSLLVLRQLRGNSDDGSGLPHLSVSVALVLAMVGLAVLIYYIHHIASSIQAENVVLSVAVELHQAIDRLYPDPVGAVPRQAPLPAEDVLPADFEQRSAPVTAASTGYVQLIDEQALLKKGAEADMLFVMSHRPGHFVIQDSPLLLAWPKERLTEQQAANICRAVVLGPGSTPVQDVEHGVEQLVQIVLRALSPGVNDPFTALACIDRVGAALHQMAGREIPSPYRTDDRGKLRLVVWRVGFAQVADAAFRQIRQQTRANTALKIRLLEAIRNAAPAVRREEDRQCLVEHTKLIGEDIEQIGQDTDQRAIREALEEALRELQRR